jgi:hypothetical protein
MTYKSVIFMGHGAAKKGRGRKKKFESDSETTHIRVPLEYKEEIEKLIVDFVRKKAEEKNLQ